MSQPGTRDRAKLRAAVEETLLACETQRDLAMSVWVIALTGADLSMVMDVSAKACAAKGWSWES